MQSTNPTTGQPTNRQLGTITIPAEITTITVVSGGDPDGALFEGTVEADLMKMGIRVVRRFERWLPLENFPEGPVILGDLPLDNRNFEKAVKQLDEHSDQILLAVGHHRGDNIFTQVLGEQRAWVDESAPSCPFILVQHGVAVAEWITRASNFLDSPRGGFMETAVARMIRWAFDNELLEFNAGARGALEGLYEAIADLARGDESAMCYIWRRAQRYEPVYESLQFAVERAQPIGRTALTTDKVVFVNLAPTDPAPLTTLFGLLYEMGHKIVVIQSWSNETPLTTVALDRGVQLDLVKAFALESGSASRIVLAGMRHEAALTHVIDTLQIVAEEPKTETQS